MRDGCLASLDEAAPTPELLSALERRCIAGMEPLGAVRGGQGGGAHLNAELSFELAASGSCVRFIAAVGELDRLTLVLLDATGAPCDEGRAFGRFAMLGGDGGVCLPIGRYRAVARSTPRAPDLVLAGYIAR